VAVASNSPKYQWLQNGSPIAGGQNSTLYLTNAAAGYYACVATNAYGQTTSDVASVTVHPTQDPGRLINISCRATVGTGASELIAGFVVGGAGTTGQQPLLVRASGPALNNFDVAGYLPDPVLTLNSATAVVATNAGWGGAPAIVKAAAQVGAFAWTSPTSADSALVETLPEGAYTAQIAGQSGDTGVALAEVYDDTPAGTYTPAKPRIVNISARVDVGTSSDILIAGFVIGGTTAKTVLVRASGPALAAFGVTGTLPDPHLQLYSGTTLLEGNFGWGGSPEISTAATTVGAFAWTVPTSEDSAVVVTLPPGSYTAQVAGDSGDSGVALVEVYEVP